MSQQVHHTLVTLLLALRSLDVPLNQTERLALNNLAKQLQTNPENEEAIVKTLENIIRQNDRLAILYNRYEDRVRQLNADSLRALFPKSSELDAIVQNIPSENPVRGVKPGQKFAEGKTQEVSNMVYRILTTPDPVATIKQLNSLAAMQQSLQSVNQ